ncbi:MAG: LysM peptidoglycan-binding domain-containing protein [Chitinophagaceae bacterium]|nr:LysM peptidoglycan-binding domain-containing protein [Chitinophagaceae bacterium]
MTSISRFLLICGLLIGVQFVSAQSPLIVQGATPQLFLKHTVVAKENWYSVGRIYNQSPKEIAPFNGTTLEKPLAIGQVLKIPLTDMNYSLDGSKASDEVLVPVHYVVADKEWMYRISIGHNKVPIANLEKWNNVTNDQLRAGMKLIVGYLKVKTGQSPLVAMATNKPVTSAEPVAKVDPPAQTTPQPGKEVVVTNPPATKPIEPAQPAPVKPEPVKTEPVKTEPVKEDPKPSGPVTTEPVVNNTTPANFKGGYFKGNFNNTGKGTAGNAAVFRSNSGWKDGKYYALMNNVPVGTIVKVSFSSTQKTIYAKVLGQMPEMKENAGLNLRISDAAASELGVTNGKFYVSCEW